MSDDQPQQAPENDEIVVTGQQIPLPQRSGPSIAQIFGRVAGYAINPGALVQDASALATRTADKELSGTSRLSRVAADGIATVDAERAREYDDQLNTGSGNSTRLGGLVGAVRDLAIDRAIGVATGGFVDVARGVKSVLEDLPEESRRHLHAIESLAAADMPGFAYQQIPMGDRMVGVYIDATEAVGDPRENNIFDKITGDDGLSDAQKDQIRQVRDQMAVQARQEIAEFEARHPEARSEGQMQDAYERVLRGTMQSMQPIAVPDAVRVMERDFMNGEMTLEELGTAYANAAVDDQDGITSDDIDRAMRRLEHRGVLDTDQTTAFHHQVTDKIDALQQAALRQQLGPIIDNYQAGSINAYELELILTGDVDVAGVSGGQNIVNEVMRNKGMNEAQITEINEAVARRQRELGTAAEPQQQGQNLFAQQQEETRRLLDAQQQQTRIALEGTQRPLVATPGGAAP